MRKAILGVLAVLAVLFTAGVLMWVLLRAPGPESIVSRADMSSQASMPPTSAIDVTNADILATLNSPEGGTDRQIRVVDLGKYNLAIGVIHRGPSGDDGPVTGIVHSQVTETYVIRSGSGTLVTGGTLIDSRTISADSTVVTVLNGPTEFGTNEGGRRRRVETGDVIIIPAGVFHGWTEIEDHVTYLSVRPDPDHVLPAGYVNPALEK